MTSQLCAIYSFCVSDNVTGKEGEREKENEKERECPVTFNHHVSFELFHDEGSMGGKKWHRG